MTQPPLIASFVVRLLRAGGGEEDSLRVMVRHVQTGKEVRFVRLTDAMAFMERFTEDPVTEKRC